MPAFPLELGGPGVGAGVGSGAGAGTGDSDGVDALPDEFFAQDSFDSLKSKYKKLAALYVKSREKSTALKQGLVQERARADALEARMQDKDNEIRRRVAEADNAEAQAARLRSRCQQLQKQVQDMVASAASSTAAANSGWMGSFLGGGLSPKEEELARELSVARQELSSHIAENQRVHMQMFEQREEASAALAAASDRVEELRRALGLRDQELRQCAAERTALATALAELQNAQRASCHASADQLARAEALASARARTLRAVRARLGRRLRAARAKLAETLPFDDARRPRWVAWNLPVFRRGALDAKAALAAGAHGLCTALAGLVRRLGRALGSKAEAVVAARGVVAAAAAAEGQGALLLPTTTAAGGGSGGGGGGVGSAAQVGLGARAEEAAGALEGVARCCAWVAGALQRTRERSTVGVGMGVGGGGYEGPREEKEGEHNVAGEAMASAGTEEGTAIDLTWEQEERELAALGLSLPTSASLSTPSAPAPARALGLLPSLLAAAAAAVASLLDRAATGVEEDATLFHPGPGRVPADKQALWWAHKAGLLQALAVARDMVSSASATLLTLLHAHTRDAATTRAQTQPTADAAESPFASASGGLFPGFLAARPGGMWSATDRAMASSLPPLPQRSAPSSSSPSSSSLSPSPSPSASLVQLPALWTPGPRAAWLLDLAFLLPSTFTSASADADFTSPTSSGSPSSSFSSSSATSLAEPGSLWTPSRPSTTRNSHLSPSSSSPYPRPSPLPFPLSSPTASSASTPSSSSSSSTAPSLAPLYLFFSTLASALEVVVSRHLAVATVERTIFGAGARLREANDATTAALNEAVHALAAFAAQARSLGGDLTQHLLAGGRPSVRGAFRSVGRGPEPSPVPRLDHEGGEGEREREGEEWEEMWEEDDDHEEADLEEEERGGEHDEAEAEREGLLPRASQSHPTSLSVVVPLAPGSAVDPGSAGASGPVSVPVSVPVPVVREVDLMVLHARTHGYLRAVRSAARAEHDSHAAEEDLVTRCTLAEIARAVTGGAVTGEAIAASVNATGVPTAPTDAADCEGDVRVPYAVARVLRAELRRAGTRQAQLQAIVTALTRRVTDLEAHAAELTTTLESARAALATASATHSAASATHFAERASLSTALETAQRELDTVRARLTALQTRHEELEVREARRRQEELEGEGAAGTGSAAAAGPGAVTAAAAMATAEALRAQLRAVCAAHVQVTRVLAVRTADRAAAVNQACALRQRLERLEGGATEAKRAGVPAPVKATSTVTATATSLAAEAGVPLDDSLWGLLAGAGPLTTTTTATATAAATANAVATTATATVDATPADTGTPPLATPPASIPVDVFDFANGGAETASSNVDPTAPEPATALVPAIIASPSPSPTASPSAPPSALDESLLHFIQSHLQDGASTTVAPVTGGKFAPLPPVFAPSDDPEPLSPQDLDAAIAALLTTLGPLSAPTASQPPPLASSCSAATSLASLPPPSTSASPAPPPLLAVPRSKSKYRVSYRLQPPSITPSPAPSHPGPTSSATHTTPAPADEAGAARRLRQVALETARVEHRVELLQLHALLQATDARALSLVTVLREMSLAVLRAARARAKAEHAAAEEAAARGKVEHQAAQAREAQEQVVADMAGTIVKLTNRLEELEQVTGRVWTRTD